MLDSRCGRLPGRMEPVHVGTALLLVGLVLAASKVPSPSTTRTTTIVRFLPYMSPSRPAIGVKTDALSR